MLLVRHPQSYDAEREYVIDVVLGEFVGVEYRRAGGSVADVEITLPAQDDGKRLAIADVLFRTPQPDWLTAAGLPETPLDSWRLEGPLRGANVVSPVLPVIFGKRLANGSFVSETDDGLSIGADLFGSAFFMLTRYEEIARPVRDEHERFPAAASLAQREGFLRRPLVNEYAEVLWAALAHLWPGLTRSRREFRQHVSHDVDWPLSGVRTLRQTARAAVGDVVKRRDPSLARARARAFAARRRGDLDADVCNTFDLIMDLSERRGLRSAFYFMAGRTSPSFDGDYSLSDPWIQRLLRRIHERGHELGLHPSYETFRDASRVQAELDRLLGACAELGIEQSAWGGRQHFLRWENPTTWQSWEDAGCSYDSSLGFGDEPGFRCGSCTTYPVFNLASRERLRLLERPLVVMESSLLDDTDAGDAGVLHAIGELRRRCHLFGGEFTLLWHNSRLITQRERRLYSAAIDAGE